VSAWHGPCHRGAMREHREDKRQDALNRNEFTEPRNRSVNRQRAKRPKRSAPEQVAAPAATEAA
jgi:hypothetical protein